MSDSIQDMREKLQGPRRPHDTWYGKTVMRRLSIYLTLAFAKTEISPISVTLLSIVAGLFGASRLWQGYWLSGILWINAWYLLDHVDGELARLKKLTSATGLFFDTLANAIVQPLMFYSIGVALSQVQGQSPIWRDIGALSAFGSLMMLVVPFCRAETLYSLSARPAKKEADAESASVPFPKKAFALLHHCITFPVVLPAATLLTLVFSLTDSWTLESWLSKLLLLHAFCISVVWIGITANTILKRKIDQAL